MSVLVTGAAGFIGSHVTRALLARGETVVGVDNFSEYYDPVLKFARLKPLREDKGFTFLEADISDREAMLALADRHGDIDRIVHLAAQPGVRHSLVDPYVYVQTNVMGHLVMLELARRFKDLKHFVYASSSSVYGGNRKLPFSTDDPVDRPVSLYAATKRADELMAETYTHLFGLKATGLRYFTVYGPWGRPDMSPYIFAKAIHEGRTIELYHLGFVKRDYSYIDDIVDGTIAVLDKPAEAAEPPALQSRRLAQRGHRPRRLPVREGAGPRGQGRAEARRSLRHAGNRRRHLRHHPRFRLDPEGPGGRGHPEIRRVVQELLSAVERLQCRPRCRPTTTSS